MRPALLCLTVATFVSAAFALNAQDETAHAVAGGGISATGWKGAVDAREAQAGKTVNDAKLAEEGGVLQVKTGPAITYWDTANQQSGDYTVSATFTEPKYMDQNTHPHPYGIVVAGNEMGTPQQTYLYCAAYGSGNFIVRGFGPEPFQLNGKHGEENAAVHKAAGPGQPVTQEIAVSVKGGKVSCSINGTEVASYDKSAVIGAGKLKSTDGAYGIRAAHNTTFNVSGLKATKN